MFGFIALPTLTPETGWETGQIELTPPAALLSVLPASRSWGFSEPLSS